MKRLLLTGTQTEAIRDLQSLLTNAERELLAAFSPADAMRMLHFLPFDLVVQCGSYGETTDAWLMQTAQSRHTEVQWLRRIGSLEELSHRVQQALNQQEINEQFSMDRKSFLKKSAAAAAALATAPALKSTDLQGNQANQIIGFNHLPLQEIKTMNTVFHPADSRGRADHGWLQSFHSFSFANYYNPDRMHFGALRVLNDDTIAGGTGFGRHPHDNMEIITIPLEGGLQHQDSMGNSSVIRAGEVQVMTAGTGIQHSEFNASKEETGRFLQIWVIPRARNLSPRYDQKKFNEEDSLGQWQLLVSPYPEDSGVWVHQDIWFHQTRLQKDQRIEYALKKKGNGMYLFLIEGRALVGAQELHPRDALGMWDSSSFVLEAKEDLYALLMEIPML